MVAIAAAVFAGLAVVFTAWSAWASHRSAGSAERSARSADSSARSAAEAVELERDRRHRELTPRIEVTHDGSIGGFGEEERVWFTNNGPLDYTSVTFHFAEPNIDSPIEGFIRVTERGTEHATDGEIGPIYIGQRTFLTPRRHREDEGEGTLRLVLTCSNDQGTGRSPAGVEIPGVPSGPIIF